MTGWDFEIRPGMGSQSIIITKCQTKEAEKAQLHSCLPSDIEKQWMGRKSSISKGLPMTYQHWAARVSMLLHWIIAVQVMIKESFFAPILMMRKQRSLEFIQFLVPCTKIQRWLKNKSLNSPSDTCLLGYLRGFRPPPLTHPPFHYSKKER